MQKIGLFPISLVLFPESAYPLHIFEDRYKKLISKCIEEDLHFGINFTDKAKMSDIGCRAKVVDVIKRYDDGRMDILISGIDRYRLLQFSEGEKPYYTGNVDIYKDDEEQLDEKLYKDTLTVYNEIARKIKNINIEEIIAEELDIRYPSFLMAQKSGMTSVQKQQLLEMKSENERLRKIRGHLKRLKPLIKQAESIAKIIMNDGYYKPNLFGK